MQLRAPSSLQPQSDQSSENEDPQPLPAHGIHDHIPEAEAHSCAFVLLLQMTLWQDSCIMPWLYAFQVLIMPSACTLGHAVCRGSQRQCSCIPLRIKKFPTVKQDTMSSTAAKSSNTGLRKRSHARWQACQSSGGTHFQVVLVITATQRVAVPWSQEG